MRAWVPLVDGLDEGLEVLMGDTDEGLRKARDTLQHFPCQPAVAAYHISMPRAQDRRHHAASASPYSEPFPLGHRPLLSCCVGAPLYPQMCHIPSDLVVVRRTAYVEGSSTIDFPLRHDAHAQEFL